MGSIRRLSVLFYVSVKVNTSVNMSDRRLTFGSVPAGVYSVVHYLREIRATKLQVFNIVNINSLNLF